MRLCNITGKFNPYVMTQMGMLHTGIRLWLILASVLHVTVASLCTDKSWKYHDPTGTCMKVIIRSMIYRDAVSYCNKILGGSRNSGYLVHILTEQTDEFVKELLKTSGVDEALIGLNNRLQVNEYRWGNQTQPEVKYKGWKDEIDVADIRDRAVIITETGWNVYNLDNKAESFVCQVDAVFPQPTIKCPAAEVGQQSPGISCTLNTYDKDTPTKLIFTQNGQDIASCSSTQCYSSKNSIYATSTSRSSDSFSSSLLVTKVSRYDENGWGCYAIFGIGHPTDTLTCNLMIYTLAKKIDCRHSFSRLGVTITCNTAGVYPQQMCSWSTNSGEYFPRDQYEMSNHQYTDRQGFFHYNTECSTIFKPSRAGKHSVTVSMRPNPPGLDSFQNLPATTENISIIVAPPTEAPMMYDSKQTVLPKLLEVSENQIVYIYCNISGGTPEVSEVWIQCDSHDEIRLSDTINYIRLDISRNFHRRNCVCWGAHIVPYEKRTSVTIVVKTKATVTAFSINIMSIDDVHLTTRLTVRMRCSSSGYPEGKMLLKDPNGNTLNEVSGSQITYETTASCRVMGIYVCSVENKVDNIPHSDNRSIQLRVQCPVEHCNSSNIVERYGVAADTDVTVPICVLAYPSPRRFTLYKTMDNRQVVATRYTVNFTFSDEQTGRGNIYLLLKSVTLKDMTSYYLRYYQEGISTPTLKFALFSRGPPNCPKNLTVSHIYADLVTLSWNPGYNGGLDQIFTILSYKIIDGSPSSRTEHVMPQIRNHQSQSDLVSHNITGLSDSTHYMFNIQATNEAGSRNCSHVLVYEYTSANNSTTSGLNPTTNGSTVSSSGPNTTLSSTIKTTGSPRTTEAQASVKPTAIYLNHECHKTFMNVFIPVYLAPNSVLKLRDPSCQLLNNGTHYVISFPYDLCGTLQVSYANYIRIENEITVQLTVNDSSQIEFIQNYTIPVLCSVDRNNSLRAAFQTVTKDSIISKMEQSSSFLLREFTDSSYQNEITEYPFKVPINREIFFEVATTKNNTYGYGIKVNKCEATPSSNPNDSTRFSLISNGCSTSPAVKVIPRPGPGQFRFSTQAFHFAAPANQNNVVYIHCYVTTCIVSKCNDACSGTTRMRRNSGKIPVTLTSGTHFVTTN